MAKKEDIYDPIVAAAVRRDPSGHDLLEDEGRRLFQHPHQRFESLEEGVEAARENLAWYLQSIDTRTAARVTDFYDLRRDQQIIVRG